MYFYKALNSYLVFFTFNSLLFWNKIYVEGYTGCVSLVATHGPLGIIFSHANPDDYGVSDYVNNYDVCWSISTTDADHIKVTTEGFELQGHSGSNCLDYVAIYNADSKNDTDLVNRYCGTTLNTYTSTGKKILIWFKTDGSIVAKGFKIDFTGEYDSDVTTGKKTCTCTTGFAVISAIAVMIIIALSLLAIYLCVKLQRIDGKVKDPIRKSTKQLPTNMIEGKIDRFDNVNQGYEETNFENNEYELPTDTGMKETGDTYAELQI